VTHTVRAVTDHFGSIPIPLPPHTHLTLIGVYRRREMDSLTNKECLEFIRECWDKHGEEMYYGLTSTQIAYVEDFLINVERVVVDAA
jgi:hypothetical protein